MSNTPEEIKKLIIQARSFTPVKLNDISAGNSVNVSLGYGSVRAQALTNVNGNGIAFQTDQGNWYVIGESANDNISNGENRRQIIYRVVRPNPVDKYPVKTIYSITSDDKITFYLGGDRTSKKVKEIGNSVLTTTNEQFTVPGINFEVNIDVANSNWALVGRIVYIKDAGFYEVVFSFPGTRVLFKNTGIFGNAKPSTVIATGKTISPGGFGEIRNLGKNKFYLYAAYFQGNNNYLIHKDRINPEQEILFTDDKNKNIYLGTYFDRNYDLNANYGFPERFPEREVIAKDTLQQLRNATEISKTDVNYPDGTKYSEDYVIEIDSLNKNGDTVTSVFKKETSVVFEAFAYYLFVDSSYIMIDRSDHFGNYFLGATFSIGEYKTEDFFSRTISLERQNNQTLRTTAVTRTYDITRYFFGSILTNPPRMLWELRSVIPDPQDRTDFNFTDDLITLPYGDYPGQIKPADNPSSVTLTYQTIPTVLTGFNSTKISPIVRGITKDIALKEGVTVENYQGSGLFPDFGRKVKKAQVDYALEVERAFWPTTNIIVYQPRVTDTTVTITWDAEEKGYTYYRRHLSKRQRPPSFLDQGWTLDEIDTSTYTPYDAPEYTPIDEDIKYSAIGEEAIFFTADGEITQEFDGDIRVINGWQGGDTAPISQSGGGSQSVPNWTINSPNEPVYKRIYKYLIKKETKNIVKLKYNDKTINLKTNSLGLIDLGSGFVQVSPITLESTSFTITYTNQALRLIKNINRIDFSGAGFNGNYIVAWEIANKPCIIRGTCSKNYNTTSKTLTINCNIDLIKPNTPSSFPKKLIMDDGSFYNYLFRKNLDFYENLYFNDKYNEQNPQQPLEVENALFIDRGWKAEPFAGILSKEILTFIPLSHLHENLFAHNIGFGYTQYCGSINFQNIHDTDNIIKNKIFSVVKTDKNKAWVEQWDIQENGDVKYNKVFQVDYVPLKKPNEENNERLAIFAHSYYPT